jgi:hypothetical protein
MKKTAISVPRAALGGVAGSAAKAVLSQLNPLEVVREYVRWRVVAEEQRTERKSIKARRDIAVLAIESERKTIADYFDRRFAERRAVLDEMFRVLRHAVETKNEAALDAALRGIVQVVGDNPLSDFAAFREARSTGAVLEF